MMSENDSIVPKEAAMAELRAGQLVLRYNRVIERVLDLHHADLPVANVGTFKHCFTLQYKNNEVLLCGPSEQMAHSWINAITEAWFCEFEGIRGLCMPTDMAALQEKLDALEKKKEEEKKRKREEARQARIEARKEGKATPPEEDAERDEKKEDAEEKDAKDSIVDVQVKVDELGVPQVEVEGKAFTGGQKPAEDQGQEEIKEQTAGIPQAESTTPAPQATGELDS
ncbi:MAG: uncharacterized protein KVP18_001504 [Porospora cf. gigantea A]|nr:MAG: hypothetical protein KVP18_001504 [Porospora cf. gigantea A]